VYVFVVEAERILHESKIHEHIKEVLRHLHTEDKAWYLKSLILDGHDKSTNDAADSIDDSDDNNTHPCFDVFLHNRYLDELCTRVRHDRPRWVNISLYACLSYDAPLYPLLCL
jgi:hypothetical protein